jgi:multiple sugar transport system substrate-binding protein
MLVAAKRLTYYQDDGTVERYGFQFSNSRNRWLVFALENGVLLKDSSGRPALDHPDLLETIKFCMDLMYRHRVSPTYSGHASSATRFFANGRIAMTLSSYLEMNGFRDAPFKWEIALPMCRKSADTILISYGFAIHRGCTCPEAAIELVKFMVSPDAQRYLKQNSSSLPARRSIAEDANLEQPFIHPQGYGLFKEVLPHVKPVNVLDEGLLTILQEELDLAWSNLEKPEVGCARAQRRALELFTQQPYR